MTNDQKKFVSFYWQIKNDLRHQRDSITTTCIALITKT